MDIYFEDNYGKLYEKIESGKAINWYFEFKGCKIKHMFILREIPLKIENGPWYDIVTPYGYGGPVIIEKNVDIDRNALLQAFEESFSKFCYDNHIVSEFIRFHPFEKNAELFGELYNAQHIRNTLGTNLKLYQDPFTEEFSKGCRKNIKQAINKGVSWRITPRPDNISVFKNIYYSTMDRNNATDYYYFDDEYFNNCLNYFKENLLFVEAIYEEKTIAAGLYFIYDKTIHIHLSGTLSEYLYLSPAYILRYATMLWGKENGYEMIHHGGGRSNKLDDSLYTFKKQFAKNTEFEFYVGKKIWNLEIYNKLCEVSGHTQESDYFPLYRM